jgi:hypothetical protein
VQKREENCTKSGGNWGPEEGGCLSCKKNGGTLEFGPTNEVVHASKAAAQSPTFDDDYAEDVENDENRTPTAQQYIIQCRELADLKEGLYDFILKKHSAPNETVMELKNDMVKEIHKFRLFIDDYEKNIIEDDEDEIGPAREILEESTQNIIDQFEFFTKSLGLTPQYVERLETEYLKTKDEPRPSSPKGKTPSPTKVPTPRAPAEKAASAAKAAATLAEVAPSPKAANADEETEFNIDSPGSKVPNQKKQKAAKKAAQKAAKEAKDNADKADKAAKKAAQKAAKEAKDNADKADKAAQKAAKKEAATAKGKAAKAKKANQPPSTLKQPSARVRDNQPSINEEELQKMLQNLDTTDDFEDDDPAIFAKKRKEPKKSRNKPIEMSAEDKAQIDIIFEHLNSINPAITRDILSTKHTKKTQLSALKKAYTYSTGESRDNKISKTAWAKCMKCKIDKTDNFDKVQVNDCLSNPTSYDSKTCTKKITKPRKRTMVEIARAFVTAKKNDYVKKGKSEEAKMFATALLRGQVIAPKQELALYIGLLKKFVPNVNPAKNREKYVKRCLSNCPDNIVLMDCIKSVNNGETRLKYNEKCEDQTLKAEKDKTGLLTTPVYRPRKPKQTAGKRTKQKRSQKKRTRKASFFGLF